MSKYRVVLKSLKAEGEKIVLEDDITTEEYAQHVRRQWRKVLGNKRWIINRRPGLDTLDHLAICLEYVK